MINLYAQDKNIGGKFDDRPQAKEIDAKTYFDLLNLREYPQGITESIKAEIDKLRNEHREALIKFQKNYDTGDRKSYALKSLFKVYEQTNIAEKPLYSYDNAIAIVRAGYPAIIESVKNETTINVGGDEVGIGEDKSWTVKTWLNVLQMLEFRARYQYSDIEKREAKTEQEIAIKEAELNIKEYYLSMVLGLKEKIAAIYEGNNPQKKKLSFNDKIPDSWLFGRGGGRGGGYPGGRDHGRRGHGGYPGEDEVDEGFDEKRSQFVNFPFSNKGRGDYLYVKELLKAFELDTNPQFAILMDASARSALPGLPWRSGDFINTRKSLGNDEELFNKYVPALNLAIKQIVSAYEAGENVDQKQVDLGKQYQSATKTIMRRLGLKELPLEQEEYEGTTEAGKPEQKRTERAALPETMKQGSAKENWDAMFEEHGADFANRVDKYLKPRGFEYNDAAKSWVKFDENGYVSIVVSNKDGTIARAFVKSKDPNKVTKWKVIGNLLDSANFSGFSGHLDESRPAKSSPGNSGFNASVNVGARG